MYIRKEIGWLTIYDRSAEPVSFFLLSAFDLWNEFFTHLAYQYNIFVRKNDDEYYDNLDVIIPVLNKLLS